MSLNSFWDHPDETCLFVKLCSALWAFEPHSRSGVRVTDLKCTLNELGSDMLALQFGQHAHKSKVRPQPLPQVLAVRF